MTAPKKRTHPFLSHREGRTDNWSTPRWLLDLLFPDGRWYDPCPIKGNGGLNAKWPTDRPVFINPPYSKVLPWILRAVKHRGPIILLLRDDRSTSWYDYSVWFKVTPIGQRLRFGIGEKAASFPSVIWRKDGPR